MTISIARFNKINKERKEIRKILFANPKFGFEKGEKYMTKAFDGIISAQQYGVRFEDYIINKFQGRRVKKKEDRGDLYLKDKYSEIKVSIINDSNEDLNLVQIRLYQDVDYYICMALDNRENKVKIYYYLLTKEEMQTEVNLCKANNAHGTKNSNKDNLNQEKRISININDKNLHFIRWNNLYGKKSLKEIQKIICK